MLIVTVEKLEVNRTTAWSSNLLAPYAVDPAAFLARTDRDARRVTYGLSERGAQIVMGQALEYEVANEDPPETKRTVRVPVS